MSTIPPHICRGITNLSNKFRAEVWNRSGNPFHIGKCVHKCTDAYVEGTVRTELLYNLPVLFLCHWCTSWIIIDEMIRFTHQGLVDMHLAYETAGENCQRARKIYEDRYCSRYMPQHQMFECVQLNLCELDSLSSNLQDKGENCYHRRASLIVHRR